MRTWGCILALLVGLASTGAGRVQTDADWPAISSQARPWVRWFWMGNAVEPAELTRELEAYSAAGLGGVEVYPVYGVRGAEDRSIEYLSPRWMSMLDHTTGEARRLGLAVDMICGTGWPFGGPNVNVDDAAAKILLRTFALRAGQKLAQPLGAKPLALLAYDAFGKPLDLTARVDADGDLDWVAPDGEWKLYALEKRPTGQKVKRPALGGAGLVLDPFRAGPVRRYLARFDAAFGAGAHGIRAFFNDSYEVYGADWTAALLDEFKARRGYDLREELRAFAGDADGDAERIARVRCDYRETVSDLLLEGFTESWTAWCRRHGALARNQAHGSPGNLLDLYAASDIPETESFGPDGADIAFSKFASSAAHLSGGQLASAEACTWLGEHFRVAPAQIKGCLDDLFLAGINHVVLQGAAYSPADVPWPGWLFYASIDFGPTGGLWHDFAAITGYVARCQSFLQSGQSDEDLLLYHPVHDLWMTNDAAEGRLQFLRIHNARDWLHRQPVGKAARFMLDRGYAFDYASDRLLGTAKPAPSGIQLGDGTNHAILIPRARFLPASTMRQLVKLADNGATVLFEGPLPDDVPGLGHLEERRSQLRRTLDSLHWVNTPRDGVRQAPAGKGRFLQSEDLAALLEMAALRREPCTDHGIAFLRRRDADGHHYFLVNRGPARFDGWMPVAVPAAAAAAILFDCDTAERGAASLRARGSTAEVYVQLEPGQSLVLKTLTRAQADADVAACRYLQLAGPDRPLAGTWELKFLEGGPQLPPDARLDALKSWTDLAAPAVKSFSGTARYVLHFYLPAGIAQGEWMLDLGNVRETARITLNGRRIGTLWHPPYRVEVGRDLKPGLNTLELEVTNLAANRVAYLDRRKVRWKVFDDINFVNIDYRPFDASRWDPFPSGLLGPVRLIACRPVRPAPTQ